MPSNNQNSLKKQNDPLGNFNDPIKSGTSALILAFVSFLIFGRGLSMMAIIFGIFGVYKSIKLKSGTKALLINIAAILLGIVSQGLLAVFGNK